jgi:ubiquinone/menaquinone biosynthesis C-methylase UbiE
MTERTERDVENERGAVPESRSVIIICTVFATANRRRMRWATRVGFRFQEASPWSILGRMTDVYTHGHHASVLRSHTWRTAQNSAAYLLGELSAGQRLLDVGCGPGTITLDFAALLAPGEVIGIDRGAEVIAKAERAREQAGVSNARFAVGDVYDLDFDDGSFDVVHAHQVLQHLTDPVRALREMRRVLRASGVLAVRDSDYAAFGLAPDDAALTRWGALYQQVARRNGAEPNAGRYLLGWVQAAGFRDITPSSSTWTYATPELRAWWGELWAERALESGFAVQAVEYGLADRAQLQQISDAWRRWSTEGAGYLMVPHGEILARVGDAATFQQP